MPGQFRKTRTFGAFVIAMSLVSNSVGAAAVQAPFPVRAAPMTYVPTLDRGEIVKVGNHRRGDGARHRDGRRDQRRSHRNRGHRGDGGYRGRGGYRGDRHSGHRYRHGYRGSRHYQPGYRRDNDGWWFPLAAFALGAIIVDQHNRSRSQSRSYAPAYGGWNHIPSGNMRAHDDWCDYKYRSYSRATKTFQPYQGPRRYCNSPYDLL